MRHTKSQRNRSRSHDALRAKVFTKCPKCGESVLPHRACGNCGTYKGRKVVDVLVKLDKKARKKKERELAAQEKSGAKDKPLDATELSK